MRKGKHGGVILVAIKDGLCLSVMIDAVGNAELVAVGLDFGGSHFRLIFVNSPQENNAVTELDNV